MATQQLLEALQSVLDGTRHLPAANSTDNTCAGRLRLVLEAESVSREAIVTALRVTANPLSNKGEAVEPRLMQQMVDKSGKNSASSFTH